MRIHDNQFDQTQVSALLAAAKTEAREEAERTRKKLSIAASAMAGDSDDCVVSLSGDDSPNHGSGGQNEQNPSGEPEDEDPANPFNDWA
jgi:hypothetical protein